MGTSPRRPRLDTPTPRRADRLLALDLLVDLVLFLHGALEALEENLAPCGLLLAQAIFFGVADVGARPDVFDVEHLGVEVLLDVENHHNFGWREKIPAPKGFGAPEREVYVHRKGATPAGKGVMGIIPGSMGDAGYIVRGKGVAESLNSASHGAGRQMSRKQATQSITKTERDRYLKERGVTLIGGGLDEAPQAYKPIEQVISAQLDLVDVVAKIKPVMVRMATEGGDF